ncbi:hypothetical protein ACHAW6_014765 [Cyclotella cf. meneghiniana]
MMISLIFFIIIINHDSSPTPANGFGPPRSYIDVSWSTRAAKAIEEDNLSTHHQHPRLTFPRNRARSKLKLFHSLASEEHSPRVPLNAIQSRTLISEETNLCSLKDLKTVLHSHGRKTSGNKSQLMDELDKQLDLSKKTLVEKQENYRRMTVKELRDTLRMRGGKITGSKADLILRLIDLDEKSVYSTAQTLDHYSNVEWYALEPIISRESRYANSSVFSIFDQAGSVHMELPVLSTLLFVNKPSGMSTLPTRQQLVHKIVENSGKQDDLRPPSFPCLSESVQEWLMNHPVGVKRMERAMKDEDQWWDTLLKSLSCVNDHNVQKLWKKKKKQHDKHTEKLSTFAPRPVHRLDIDTSGIVCIALTPYALRTAGMLFERKSRESSEGNEEVEKVNSQSVDKRYVALVEGAISSRGNRKQEQFMISHSIGKIWIQDSPGNDDSNDGHHEWACDIAGDGSIAFCRPGDTDRRKPLEFVQGSLRDALTSCRVVDMEVNNTSKMDATRVELIPHTGRGHQLRLHMASLGHPVVGDHMHGVFQERKLLPEFNGGKLCLHASNLSIECWAWHENKIQRCRAIVSSPPQF